MILPLLMCVKAVAFSFMFQPAFGTSFAVCVIGETRTLRHPLIYRSFKTKFLSQLPGTVDLYFVVQSALDNATVEAMHELGAKQITLFDVPEYKPACSDPLFHTHHAKTFYGISVRLSSCVASVESREKTLNIRYDYFVRVRPDMLFYPDASSWLHTNEQAIFVGYYLPVSECSKYYVSNDFFAIVPRVFLHRYNKLSNVLSSCNLSATDFFNAACHICAEVAPECFLSLFLLTEELPYFGCFPQFQVGKKKYSGLWTLTSEILVDDKQELWDRHHSKLAKSVLDGSIDLRPPAPVCKFVPAQSNALTKGVLTHIRQRVRNLWT